MPILYPIACVNFLVMFGTYKALLVKYYSKTTAFNQDLIKMGIYHLKFGVVMHVLMTAFFIQGGEGKIAHAGAAYSGFAGTMIYFYFYIGFFLRIPII